MSHLATASDSGSRETAIRNGMLLALLDTVIVTVALVAANSSVLLADFFKTLLELVAVMLSWLAIRRINRGANQQFEYGMGKMEHLVSLFVGLLMAVCLLLITVNAVRNILHPSHIEGIGILISIGDQIVYAFVNAALWLKNRSAARAGASPLMEAQSKLFLTRMIGNVFILLSLGLSMALKQFSWAAYIDPAASLLIGASILMAAMGLFSTSVSNLLDRTLEESDQIVILRELARHFDDYESLHTIRSRRAGTQVFVDILLEFDPEKKVGEVQKAIDDIRRSIEQAIRGSRVTIGLATSPQ
jgi:ferrous-iron efflux pump FieF